MNDVEQVKERLDIAEVISAYVPLKPAGRNLKAPCPFHHEKTASFMVSPEKAIWHCFGCHEGGDVISFVMKYEGLDFLQALEKLATRAGVELKPRQGGGNKKLKERLSLATSLAVKYYQASLVKNPRALNYATKQRGLSKSTIKDFGVGYSPDSWSALSDFLVKKGFSHAELLQAGLAGQRSGRPSVYDLFRGRLMFSICDGDGRPVGFTGRVLDEGQPKYLNTPQTPLYDKSRVIFGLHLAKPAIREAGEVVLVEGNMDAISSHQAGVKNVVAVSGTALTTDQLKILGRLTKNLKLCFDADGAGLRATERAIELSQNLSVTLSMVRLPQGKDPDDLIKKDVQAWRQAIAEALPAVDYLFEALEAQYDITTAAGKRGYSDRLAENLRRLGDPVERDHYVQLMAEKLGISQEAVRQKMEASPQQAKPRHAEPAVYKSQPAVMPAKQLLEESVLAVNLAYPALRSSMEDLTPAHFSDPDNQLILEALQRTGDGPAESVAERLPNQADKVKILSLRGEEQYGSFAPADRSYEAFILARRLQTSSNKDTKTKLSRKLKEAEAAGDTQLARQLLAQYQALISKDD